MFSEENPVKTNALRSRLSELRHVFAGIECDYAIAAALSFAATGNTNLACAAGAADFIARFRVTSDHLNNAVRNLLATSTPRVAQWVWQPDTVKW